VAAHGTESSRPPRGVACAAHVFAAHVRADPGLVWAALTDPGQTTAFLNGLAAHSTWIPGDPIEFRVGGRTEAIGRVLHVRCRERLSYLQVDEVEHADSPQDAEDLWLPILAALQFLLSPAGDNR